MLKGLLISCCAIMLALLPALIYSRYRLKQRNNRQLREQEEEIRSQYLSLKKLNTAQKKLLAEKEYLIKELHHRIRNNLQIVISLLNAQSDFLESPPALLAIRESRERMQAIALIHQKLYQTDNAALIYMRSYIQELVASLESSFTDRGGISFQLDIDPITLDMSQAVPLGLILNEGITNAVKYAFPPGQSGEISVALRQGPGQEIFLKIADKGKGLPHDFDLSESHSLGVQLMKLFAEQLEGEISFHTGDGVQISLIFKQQHTA
jgi:two-component sensor histidine kinase